MKFKTTLLCTACVGLALVAAPVTTWAGGFYAARFGSELGHPATDHPTAIYYNPAGLALSTGTHLYVEGMFIYRTATYDRAQGAIDNVIPEGETGTGTPADAVSANAGEATLANALAAPFAAVVTDLGIENLGLGVGVYAPFGGSATWDQNEDYASSEQYPGAIDGTARWASIEGSQQAIYLTAAGAYRVPAARLSFGLGINVVRESIDTVRARNATGFDDLVGSNGAIVEGRSLVEVSGTTLSLGGGVMWEPMDQLRVGASYQSQPGFGEHALTGTLTNKYGTGASVPGDIELMQSLPDVIRLGGRYLLNDKIELRLSGDYQRWSVFDKQCLLDANDPDRKCALLADGSVDVDNGGSGVIVNIPRDYNDSFGVRVGGSYYLSPRIELFLGASYDSNAVPDETIDPALMDMDKVTGGLGGQFHLMDGRVTLLASLLQVIYFERTTDPRPRNADGVVVEPVAPSRNPDMAGTYSVGLTLLNVGVGYNF